MVRPCKKRKIDKNLNISCFLPEGFNKNNIGKVELDICEIQAIKLSCQDGLSQIDGAKKMEISPSTFNRILKSGQKKIANALLNNKAIKINDK